MIKKLYGFGNAREIWRLMPAGDNKLLIEERDKKTKEVFFSCIDIPSGKKFLKSFQLNDKYWVGVETVRNDVIYFHRYIKPDLPTHKDIIAYDMNKKEILWTKNNLIFLTFSNDNLIAYKPVFEGREYFKLDVATGKVINKLEQPPDEETTEEIQNSVLKDFRFSNIFGSSLELDDNIRNIIGKTKEKNVIMGRIEFIAHNSLLLMSFHTPAKKGKLNKLLIAVDIVTGKIILKKIINSNIEVFIPDSFFLIKNHLFVLVETKKLFCYILEPDLKR